MPMVMMMVMSAAADSILIIMMVMLVLLILVMIMVMMVLVLLILIMIVMMMVLVFLILVMIVVMMVPLFLFLIMIVMMVMVLMLLLIRIIFEILHDVFHICGVLHRFQDLLSGYIIPCGGDDPCFTVMLADLCYRFRQLLIGYILRSAEHHGSCGLDLIQEEFTKVLHVNLRLGHIHHSCSCIQLQIHGFRRLLDRLYHIGKLSDARRLDDDAVRMVLLHYLLQSFAEVTYQRTADAAGIQFIYNDAGILQKPSVNTDLTEFILDQNHLLTGKNLLQKLFDQRCFSGA